MDLVSPNTTLNASPYIINTLLGSVHLTGDRPLAYRSPGYQGTAIRKPVLIFFSFLVLADST